MNTLAQLIPTPWRAALGNLVTSEKFDELSAYVQAEREAHTIFPHEADTFSALQACPPEQVRVLILGQDPYHGAGQAHGLAFSVRRGQAIPPSLRNMYKERESDLGLAAPPHGELTKWARQGVLLLNTVLTVREAKAHSHKKRGWESVTDAIVDTIARREHSAVFVLWGKPAQKKAKRIPSHHRILESAHPSPLSAYRGFFGSEPYSQINAQLEAWGDAPIDWRVEGES